MQTVIERFVDAGKKMCADGWWSQIDPAQTKPDPLTLKTIRKQLLREIVLTKLGFSS
jgi:hypothetical protein